jgi:ribonuclease HII
MLQTTANLIVSCSGKLLEAGCDEAGRGCLAGPVFAAAVILPLDFDGTGLNDSKQLSLAQRRELRHFIENNALAWAVASVDHKAIDQINILQASFLAMHMAVKKLGMAPELLLIDGNRFMPFPGIPHACFVKGDARFMSIAAASVLAKTHRDEYMQQIHQQHPVYGWDRNKGYPTAAHISALQTHGLSPYHRLSFKLKRQMKIPLVF